MELIDTHCHLTFPELEKNIDTVLEQSTKAGVISWITVGTDPAQNQKVIELTKKYDNMYAALGFHPHEAKEITGGDLESLKEMAQNEKVVAIGETGLDFHYNFSKQDAQRDVFRKQLQIAADLQKPVVVHSRNAFDETMGILDEFSGKLENVVFHCYGGDLDQTRLVLEKGYYVSFTGIVTFKKCDDIRETVKIVPLDRLMIETDCPYISPEPVRGKRPCEPAFLIHTAQKVAEVKKMDLKEFAEAVTATSKGFFGLI